MYRYFSLSLHLNTPILVLLVYHTNSYTAPCELGDLFDACQKKIEKVLNTFSVHFGNCDIIHSVISDIGTCLMLSIQKVS